MLTRPVYRASVTLKANPPTVAVSDQQSRKQDMQSVNTFDFVATQVGLLGSRAVGERTAQEPNLANYRTSFHKIPTRRSGCAPQLASCKAGSR